MDRSSRSSALSRKIQLLYILLCFVLSLILCAVNIALQIRSNNDGKISGHFTERCNCDANVAAIPPTKPATRVTSELYGVLQDGRKVTRYTLRNGHMQVDILNFGGIVTKIEVQNMDGNTDDIILGYDSLQDYERQNVSLGAVVGRYANQIAGNRFRLDGVEYFLDEDDGLGINGSNNRGFSKRLWDSHIEDDTLVLTYHSPDGEGGFPGNVNASVTYDLTENNELVINYWATTDKPTVINLTNRLFFNLNGHASGDIKDHIVRIAADKYTPLDTDQVPTGEKASIRGTMYDTTAGTQLRHRLPRLPGDRGFDINFAFGNSGWDTHMASVTHGNGRTMDVYSTEPGLQFNTGYHLQGTIGKGGVVYKQYGGLLLEAQHYPNSPNEPRFPTTIVRPDTPYTQTTKYVFGNSKKKSRLDYVFNPITTTVALNTTLNTSLSATQDNGHTGVISTRSNSFATLIVAILLAVVNLCLCVVLFVICKKCKSLEEMVLLRQIFCKTKDQTTEQEIYLEHTCTDILTSEVCSNKEPNINPKHQTTAMVQQPEDNPHELDQDPEQRGMLQDQACVYMEPVPQTEEDTQYISLGWKPG